MDISINEINIIIPMAGLGSRFSSYGFKTDKYLLPIDKNLLTMIELAILSLVNKIKNIKCNFIFIIRNNNFIYIQQLLHKLCDNNNFGYKIISIDYLTEGPASTCYLAKDLIMNDIPLIISNSDQVLDWNFMDFLGSSIKYDGCVLTYNPNYKIVIGSNDKHSFVKLDDNGNAVEFVEKCAISKEALVGVHFYNSGKKFIESYEYIYNNNIRAPNGEFYLSYTYQALLHMNYKVGTYKLKNNEYFYPVGEPDDYFNYYNKRCPIEKYTINLNNINLIKTRLNEYKDIFTVNFNNVNEEIEITNKLFILVSGKTNLDTNIFVISNKNVIFLEDTKYILFNLHSEIKNESIDETKYTRGWLIGDFIPSIEKNKNAEIGYLYHEKMSTWDYHYHKESIEINILVNGSEQINGITYQANDLFIIDKNIISCPIFLDNCEIICIKIPSMPKDKYNI
jgi:dTDP-glucose pyrophosphorylase